MRGKGLVLLLPSLASGYWLRAPALRAKPIVLVTSRPLTYRSRGAQHSAAMGDAEEQEPVTRKRRSSKSINEPPAAADAPNKDATKAPPKRSRVKKAVIEEEGKTDVSVSAVTVQKTIRPRKERAVIARTRTEPRIRDPVLPPGRKALAIVSWNVAGLRGLLKKSDAVSSLVEWVNTERPDIICLQETKLQEANVPEVEAALRELLPRYTAGYWSCSTAKKGYSGVAILVAGDVGLAVESVKYGIGCPEGDAEGRVVTLDLGCLYLTAVYTPNSGEGLRRLDYRTENWDKRFTAHLRDLGAGGKGIVCVGDLNVCHEDVDFHNPWEERMKKAAGTTPEERASFAELLSLTGMVDSFRWRHGPVKGVYTYWSMRAGNKVFNRGLRLDYVLTSSQLAVRDATVFPQLLDAFVHDEDELLHGLSDHCPVGVLLAV